jgi:ketosteroid isomerase-like protein
VLHALLLLALVQADTTRASLVRADSAYRAAVQQSGFAKATADVLADDAVVVYGGAPVVEGRPRASRLLTSQPALDSIHVGWEPAEVWMSRDGSFGVIYSRTTVQPRSGTGTPARGVFISAWRRSDRWRLLGFMATTLTRPSDTRLAREIGPLTHPQVSVRGPLSDMVAADAAFSALAQRTSAAEAFRAYAAPTAIVLGAAETLRGPEAIGASFARGQKAKWVWHPVAVRGSPDGDLGFTVGEAIITPADSAIPPAYSKYLTVWTRMADGTVRYLTDGGNPRPKP